MASAIVVLMKFLDQQLLVFEDQNGPIRKIVGMPSNHFQQKRKSQNLRAIFPVTFMVSAL